MVYWLFAEETYPWPLELVETELVSNPLRFFALQEKNNTFVVEN